MTTSAADGRWVDLQGGSNVRDLGGLPLAGGGTTRAGVLFRGDTPQEWTEHDRDVWRSRGLSLVVDLRAPAEVAAEGRAVLQGVSWENHPLVPDEAIVPGSEPPSDSDEAIIIDADVDDRVRHYLGYFTGFGGPHLVRAVRTLADADGPALFHCAAGKDRTGVLAAVLSELVGVDRDAVVADYAATSERIDGVDARLRRLPTYAPGLADVPKDLLLARPEVMADLLAAVDAHLGGAERWALRGGVPAASLERLRERLRT